MNDLDFAAFRNERATRVRLIWIATNEDDDRMRDVTIRLTENTTQALSPMNLRELGQLRRVIVDELLGGSDRGVLVHAIARRLRDQAFPNSVEDAVSQVLDALDIAHTEIKKICALQEELRKEKGKEKISDFAPEPADPAVYSAVEAAFTEKMTAAVTVPEKLERYAKIDEVKAEIKEQFQPADGLDEDAAAKYSSDVSGAAKDLEKNITRKLIAVDKKRPDGRYDVTLTIEAKKMYADGKGKETEAPIKDAVFDVGVFSAEPGKKAFSSKDVLAFRSVPLKTGSQTVVITVDKPPKFAGVDPYNKQIDRNSEDNAIKVS